MSELRRTVEDYTLGLLVALYHERRASQLAGHERSDHERPTDHR